MADIDGVHNANRGEIIIYRAEDNTVQLDVRMENETVWLNLNQMAMLFDRDKSVISRHIRDVFRERELSKEATVAKNATVQIEGGRAVVRCSATKKMIRSTAV